MELTQRLECTQDLNQEPFTQRSGPEQIGYLGICGQTYPVIIGPNKIGRDPQTCSIVLDMKSLSRQHAVINVLGNTKKEYMLMDLGSVNKTKLGVKTLQPYVPYQLHDGDTVQFGDVFGIFRLFQDDTDLPMTQDIGIPDTPVFHRNMTKLGQSGITTVPESPDVSDKDDSFIGSSQQPKAPEFKSPRNHFIKASGKTVMRPAIGTNKINNIFWSSSNKSPSLKLNLDESGSSLDDSSSSTVTANSVVNVKPDDVHSMATQLPYPNEEGFDSIYTANTQLPSQFDSPSIHNVDTQLPSERNSPSIHSLETQMPTVDNLPSVQKISEQQEMQIDFSISAKDNVSIHNAETQCFVADNIHDAETQNVKSIHDVNTQFVGSNNIHEAKTQAFDEDKNDDEILEDSDADETSTKKTIDSDKVSHKTISESDEEVIMNEFDDEKEDSLINMSFSKHQPNKPANVKKRDSEDEEILFDEVDGNEFDDNFESQPLIPTDLSPTKSSDKENIPIENDSQDTCSPIIGTNKCKRIIDSDDSTDCEDISIIPTQKIAKASVVDDDETDCEDNVNLKTTEGKNSKDASNKSNENVSFEEMATQIIDHETSDTRNDACFEDMPTQIIEEDKTEANKSNEECFEDMATQIIEVEKEQYSEEIISPFKVPFLSPRKTRKKDMGKMVFHVSNSNKSTPKASHIKDDEEKFYSATQDIYDDLCSQKVPSPKDDDNEVVPCSVEDFQVGDRFRDIDNQLTPKKLVAADKSSESSDPEEKITKYVSSLSSKQIKDVVGVKDVSISVPAKKSSSDLSDLEITPKKRPLKFMNIELPDSQEIKISVSQVSKKSNNATSSESEQEENSQEGTPILFKRKVRSKKKDAKMDLITKFDADALPTRVITRVRKPPTKLRKGVEGTSKSTENILKPKFLTEQEDNIDGDIITENITRLKTKKAAEKTKAPDAKDSNKTNNNKNKTESKSSSRNKKDTNTESTKTTTTRSIAKSDKSKSKKTDEKEKPTSKATIKSLKTKEIEDIINLDSENDDKKPSEDKPKAKRGRPRKDKEQTSKTDNNTTKEPKILNPKEPEKRKRTTRSASPLPDDINDKTRRSKRARTSKDKDKIETRSVSQTDSQTTRAQRSRTIKTSKDTKVPQLKSILKLQESTQNSSAVYNCSAESSSTESPAGLKRESSEPINHNTKRTRFAAATSVSRSTPSRSGKTQYVLFTAFPNDEVKSKLEKLGAVLVTDVTKCTVLVTLQIKRTFKLLCVVGLGKPIVGPNWVQACSDTNTIVDPWQYLMQDEAAEKRFHFSLQRTLAGKRNFLKGYNVSSTPSVLPSAQEMELIVKSSGGTWKEGGSNWICVSTSQDKSLWPALKKRGAILVTTELILGGVLKQTLDIESNKLKA